MDANEARVALHEKDTIKTDRLHYERNVRDTILDFIAHCDNMGNTDLAEHARLEVVRLDEQFKPS